MITDNIPLAVETLKNGKLVGMPTETVYGLAADAANEEAIKAVFKTKGRPANHPAIVHIHDLNQLNDWAKNIPDIAYRCAEQFWPGPLTMILPKANYVSPLITGGQDSIGIRMPAHPIAQQLLKQFRHAVIAPSANRFGRISPTSAKDVEEELDCAIDVILDGGNCPVGIESTIIDLRDNTINIVRQGMITASMIERALQTSIHVTTPTSRVSGNLASHYAPTTPVVIVENNVLSQEIEKNKQQICLLSFTAITTKKNITCFTMPNTPDAYAQTLYQQLRAADHIGAELIVIEQPPLGEAWGAIHDRLKRAAS